MRRFGLPASLIKVFFKKNSLKILNDFDEPETSPTIPNALLHPDWNQEPMISVTVLQTLFDPLLVQNITFPGPKGSEEKLFQFTEQQRQFASKAKVPKNVEELKKLVRLGF